MWTLDDFRVLDAVMAEGTFAAAARRLGTTRSAVSKAIKRLEEVAEAQLFVRTTHEVRATSVAKLLHERVRVILDANEEALQIVRSHQGQITGRLRLSVPSGLGLAQIVHRLPAWLAEHEGVQVDLSISDRPVSVVAERFDLVVRVVVGGALPDSELRVTRLASSRMRLCASPAYLAAQGAPRRLAELAARRCIGFSQALPDEPEVVWTLEEDGVPTPVKVSGPLRADHGVAVREAVLEGLGLGLLPGFMVAEALEEGTLVEVMPHVGTPTVHIVALRPATAYPTPAVRSVIAWLRVALTTLAPPIE